MNRTVSRWIHMHGSLLGDLATAARRLSFAAVKLSVGRDLASVHQAASVVELLADEVGAAALSGDREFDAVVTATAIAWGGVARHWLSISDASAADDRAITLRADMHRAAALLRGVVERGERAA